MGAPRNRLIWWAVPLLLLAIILYLPPYDRAFVGDDYLHLGYVADFLQQPLAVVQIFDPTWTDWYYRPLQNVWFLLCRLLFGLNPFGYYYLQTLWHILAAAALAALARQLHRHWAAPAAVLALFTIHSHHHDVVAWISSISIIMTTTFALLAIIVYVNYRARRAAPHRLIVVALLAFLAMLSHEEGVLLPIFLLAMDLTIMRTRQATRYRSLLFLVLLVAAAAMGAVHFIRPNSTITLYGQSADRWLAALNPLTIAGFILTVLARWLLLNKTVAGLTVHAAVSALPTLTILIASATGGVLILAFWRGSKRLRLALLWIVLHLTFLYLAVWLQEPDLFAGRHLYSSWAFAALALAALGRRALSLDSSSPGRQRSNWTIYLKRPNRRRLALCLLTYLLAINVAFIGVDQRAWQDHVNHVASVEAQMKQLIPAASGDTQIFAHRFVLLPSFTPYAAAVWYAEPGISGGSLDKMRAQTWVTNEAYLVDYDGDHLSNLLPDLQEHRRTAILWQAPQATVSAQGAPAEGAATFTLLQVAGPPHARRMAIRARPPAGGMLTLAYDVEAPSGARLVTDVMGPAGASFRIRLGMPDGRERIATTATVAPGASGAWLSLSIPLVSDGQMARHIMLDVSGPSGAAYWSTPRIVLD